jgi:hypothetical protein
MSTHRLAALLLFCAAAWTADDADPFAASEARWPAGAMTLEQAAAALSTGGNRVWLAEGLDERRVADLPAFAGAWWDGLAQVCDAFALRPDAGDPSLEHLDEAGLPAPVGHGAVVLSDGRMPAMQRSDGIAVFSELRAGGRIACWLRVEPRVQRGRVAWARIDRARLGDDLPLEQAASDGDVSDPAAMWEAPERLPQGTRFAATVVVSALDRWQASLRLRPGATVETTVGDDTVRAILVAEAGVTEWQGNPLPERRPLIAVAGPSALLQQAQMRFRSGETELAARGGGMRSSGDGSAVVFRYLRGAPEGEVDMAIEGRKPARRRSLELAVPLSAAGARPAEAPLEAPTPLAWPAGRAPLAEWLARLSATGNPVLPEVGVDTSAVIEVPAVGGGYWDGVVAVCRSAGLTPAMHGDGMSGGAVRLVRPGSAAPAIAACGPLLVQASPQAGRDGAIMLNLRFAVEPRLSPDSYGQPMVAWASWAVDESGRAHPIDPPRARGERANQQVRAEVADDASARTAAVETRIRLAAGGARTLELTGLVELPRSRWWRTSLEAVIGQPTEVLLGSAAVEVLPAAQPVPAAGGGTMGPGLVVRGLRGAEALNFAVSALDEATPPIQGSGSRLGSGGPGWPWLGWCRLPGEGKVTVTLAARAALPPVVLPLRLTIPVPDGL